MLGLKNMLDESKSDSLAKPMIELSLRIGRLASRANDPSVLSKLNIASNMISQAFTLITINPNGASRLYRRARAIVDSSGSRSKGESNGRKDG